MLIYKVILTTLQEYVKRLMVGSLKNKKLELGIEAHTCIPAVQEAEVGGPKFKVILGYLMRPSQRKRRRGREAGRLNSTRGPFNFYLQVTYKHHAFDLLNKCL